jgi:hypothetical protein
MLHMKIQFISQEGTQLDMNNIHQLLFLMEAHGVLGRVQPGSLYTTTAQDLSAFTLLTATYNSHIIGLFEPKGC